MSYRLSNNYQGFGTSIMAKRDLSFEIKLLAQLIMDELISERNKANFDNQIDRALQSKDIALFKQLSQDNQHYSIEY